MARAESLREQEMAHAESLRADMVRVVASRNVANPVTASHGWKSVNGVTRTDGGFTIHTLADHIDGREKVRLRGHNVEEIPVRMRGMPDAEIARYCEERCMTKQAVGYFFQTYADRLEVCGLYFAASEMERHVKGKVYVPKDGWVPRISREWISFAPCMADMAPRFWPGDAPLPGGALAPPPPPPGGLAPQLRSRTGVPTASLVDAATAGIPEYGGVPLELAMRFVPWDKIDYTTVGDKMRAPERVAVHESAAKMAQERAAQYERADETAPIRADGACGYGRVLGHLDAARNPPSVETTAPPGSYPGSGSGSSVPVVKATVVQPVPVGAAPTVPMRTVVQATVASGPPFGDAPPAYGSVAQATPVVYMTNV